MVALTLVAGLAIVGWLRPLQDHTSRPVPVPSYTDEQVASAKGSVCAAYQKVNHALGVANSRNGGTDPMGVLAVATSTRQVLDAGSRFLLTKLTEETATPADLAKALRQLANEYQELAIDYLADVSDSDMQSSFHASDQAKSEIEAICK
jgi:hypothetical protein